MREVRRQKPLWFGVLVVLVFFVSVTLAFAWLDAAGPAVPHAVDDQAACVTCHPTDGLPSAHHGRAPESCLSCHST